MKNRHFLHRVRRWLAGLFAALIIALAVTMALGQLLLPLLAHYPERLAAVLSERMQQPVTLLAVQGHWQPSGPLLSVSGLRIGRGSNALRLPEADLKIDFGAWIKRDRRWLELRLDGARAHVSIDPNGGWHVSGIELGGGVGGGKADQLADLPVGLLLRNLTLQIQDQRRQRAVRLRVPALRILTRGNRLHMGGQILQPGGAGAVEFAATIDPARAAGKAYLAGTDLNLAAWDAAFVQGRQRLRRGQGNLRLWLGWHRGRLDHLAAELDLSGILLKRVDQPDLDLPRWHGLLKLHGTRQHWRAHWQPANDGAPQAGGWLDVERFPSGALSVNAHALDIDRLSPWLALWPGDAKGQRPALAMLRPQGRLDTLHLDWRARDNFSLLAKVHGLGWKAVGGLPGIDHLDAVVRGDGEAISVDLPAQPLTVNYPGVFREPFQFVRAAGAASFWQSPSGWHLASDGLLLKADDFVLHLSGSVREEPGRALPTLDVAARVGGARVPVAKRFWPVNVMSPAAVAWLDHALVSGTVSGRALFRGNLGDWPFAHHRGRFEAVADFRDAVLDYDAGWPQAEHLDGRAVFVNLGMHVAAAGGSSLGNRTDTATAEIAHFDHAELNLDIRGQGRTSSLLAWLRNTPVGAEHQAVLSALRVAGTARYAVMLKLPLHDDPGAEPQLDGRVTLADMRLRVPDWSLDLQHLHGPLRFDTRSIRASELEGEYNDVPVDLQARIGDATHQKDAALEASMQGRFTASALVRDYPSLDWLGRVARGQAVFDIGMSMRTDPRNGRVRQQLSIDSDLAGMALDLPAPLHKPARQRQHLHVGLGLPLDGSLLAVRLGRMAAAKVRLASADLPLAADVALAGSADVPPAHGIHVRGSAPTLDISGWLGRMLAIDNGTGGNASMPEPVSMQVDTGDAVIAGHSLGALALDVAHEGDTVKVTLDGKAVAGQVNVPTQEIGKRGITLRMDRLYWPGDSNEPDEAGAGKVAVAPAVIPPLHVWVKDLRLGQARLGDVRFESVPMADGMRVEQFEAQSDDLKISARGRWRGSAAVNHSRFSMDISAGDMGRMLAAFGYPKLVAGGTTLAHIDGSWPGAPTDFSLATLDGNLKVHASDGRILEVEPGMGRLFGLFSIRELPRRLSLDFGDIFSSGYSFNTIDGQFRFDNGNAWTDDLEMRGPSADIRITGRTGVRQHDYDQQIVVTPHLGVALPVVGAIAGGPVGAAAGLAMQGLLGKGINRAGEARYRITGSWGKPDIKRIPRESTNAAAPSTAPEPAATAVAPPSAMSMPEPAASSPSIPPGKAGQPAAASTLSTGR